MGVRAAIDIDDCRIFLGRIKAYRLDEAIVEVCNAISGFDAAAGDFRSIVVFPRILGGKEGRRRSPFLGGKQRNLTCYSWR